ncbi:hypothetical protein D3C76_1607540 [compost metagenome]
MHADEGADRNAQHVGEGEAAHDVRDRPSPLLYRDDIRADRDGQGYAQPAAHRRHNPEHEQQRIC